MFWNTNSTRARTGRRAMAAAILLTISGLAGAHPGDLDASFGTGGSVDLPLPDSMPFPAVPPIAIDGAHRVIYAAHMSSSDILGALKSDGSVDSSFGSGGNIALADEVADVVVDSKNRIVVLERNQPVDDWAFTVTRYLSNGELDKHFGSGVVQITNPGGGLYAYHLALDDNDAVFAVGTAELGSGTFRIFVAKVDADGTPNRKIGAGGWSSISLVASGSEDTEASAIAVDAEGNAVVAGYTELASGTSINKLARVRADGTLDPRFGHGAGYVELDALPTETGAHYTITNDIKIDDAGNYVLAGAAGNWGNAQVAISRYVDSGELDASFNAGRPKLFGIGDSVEAQAYSVDLDRRGNIVLGGVARKSDGYTETAVWRLHENGRPDTRFGDKDGAQIPADPIWGGRAALTSRDRILTVGTKDYSSLTFTQFIGYGTPASP